MKGFGYIIRVIIEYLNKNIIRIGKNKLVMILVIIN